MNYRQPTRSAIYSRATALVALMVVLTAVSTRLRADTETTGTCGGAAVTIPFTDVPNTNIFFCAIAQAYFSGLTNGTTATTYSPAANVTREQMAAFITRTLDQSLRRGSRRAALNQWWTPAEIPATALTGTNSGPQLVASDGADLWVAVGGSNLVVRVEGSSGRYKQAWFGASNAYGVVVARGRVFVTGGANAGHLLRLSPLRTDDSTAILEAGDLGAFPQGIAYDGARIWTANFGGSVSIRSFAGGGSTTTRSAELVTPRGMLYDGANIWITDIGDDHLKRLGSAGFVSGRVAVGGDPGHPVFDGANIWVPNLSSDTVTVVRVKDTQGNPLFVPFVLATLTGNGLSGPLTAAFDGERILVTNFTGDSVSLWKAADLTPLGSVSTGANSRPFGACSDGINFWVTLNGTGGLARF